MTSGGSMGVGGEESDGEESMEGEGPSPDE